MGCDTEGMFPPSLGDVLFKATFLAQRSGAPEINIDILLAALDAPEVDPSSLLAMPPDLAGSESYGFSFNSDWISLSTRRC
jgi:hypothetical protein